MTLLDSFFAAKPCSLKICGITRADDARSLVECGVTALGVNFWPLSKRFIEPELAADWLSDLRGQMVRVAVFVNAQPDYIAEIYRAGLIDVAQLHGEESAEEMHLLQAAGIPCIKAYGVKNREDLEGLQAYAAADGILLDTAAPGIYGGTGEVFDWHLALAAKAMFPGKSLLLAGGITPANALSACEIVDPAALDVASGAEISPGIKDFAKVRALMQAIVAAR